MKGKPGFHTTVYEEDLTETTGGDPRYKYVVIGFRGTSYRVPANPGKRPRRRKGESPLDPLPE